MERFRVPTKLRSLSSRSAREGSVDNTDRDRPKDCHAVGLAVVRHVALVQLKGTA